MGFGTRLNAFELENKIEAAIENELGVVLEGELF